MSTRDHAPNTVLTENTPDLMAALDAVSASPAEPDPEPEFDFEVRARRPPEPDSPPRGATRNLGGTCPRCGDHMESRLRAHYGNDQQAKLKLTGFCIDDDCLYTVEGFSETFLMQEVQF